MLPRIFFPWEIEFRDDGFIFSQNLNYSKNYVVPRRRIPHHHNLYEPNIEQGGFLCLPLPPLSFKSLAQKIHFPITKTTPFGERLV